MASCISIFFTIKNYAMNNYITDADTRNGTISGTLLVLLIHIDPAQLLSTVIVAVSGAIASFMASVACRYCWDRFSRRNKKPGG
jgi:hypothetical protein